MTYTTCCEGQRHLDYLQGQSSTYYNSDSDKHDKVNNKGNKDDNYNS